MFRDKIDYLEKKQFTLFKIDNFLTGDLYNSLEKTFPRIDEITYNNMDIYKNKKYAFDTTSKIHEDFIKNNTNFQDFEKIIYSKKFFNFFFKKFYIDFLKSRIKKPSHLVKLLKFPKVVKSLDKNGFFYIINPFNKIKVEVQYSYILNGGKIVPHTDSGEKLLSLMLYFPSKTEDVNKQKELGTSFWNSNFSNFDNYHQYDEKNIKGKKLLYKTDFFPNVLYGFVKNHSSWHSVDEINVHENFVRRSININFYF